MKLTLEIAGRKYIAEDPQLSKQLDSIVYSLRNDKSLNGLTPQIETQLEIGHSLFIPVWREFLKDVDIEPDTAKLERSVEAKVWTEK